MLIFSLSSTSFYHHNHHHHRNDPHPHLLKHADLVVDHEEGLGGDQLLDPVEILLKLRSRLDLDVPEVKFNGKFLRGKLF